MSPPRAPRRDGPASGPESAGAGQGQEIDTPVGPARLHLDVPPAARALMLLGHGAGGGVEAPDLLAVSAAASATGIAVGRVEQPYRVAGRRAPAPARQLDLAWLAVLAAVRERVGELDLIVGGRSSGARVACRCAAAAGASGVLCLAFPLHPPGRPEKTRLPELEAVPAEIPVLVIQGERDPFGRPPGSAPQREVVLVPGTHRLGGGEEITTAVGAWLAARVI